jgi:hypothetical protein
MELAAPLIVNGDKAAASPAAQVPAVPRRWLRPALIATCLAAVVALAAWTRPAPALPDYDDVSHAPNQDAPITYRSAAEVAAAMPGSVVGGMNPLVLCVLAGK